MDNVRKFVEHVSVRIWFKCRSKTNVLFVTNALTTRCLNVTSSLQQKHLKPVLPLVVSPWQIRLGYIRTYSIHPKEPHEHDTLWTVNRMNHPTWGRWLQSICQTSIDYLQLQLRTSERLVGFTSSRVIFRI